MHSSVSVFAYARARWPARHCRSADQCSRADRPVFLSSWVMSVTYKCCAVFLFFFWFSRWEGRCTTPAATSPCDWIRSTWSTSLGGRWRIATVWRRYGYTSAARTVRAPNTCWTDRPSLERCVAGLSLCASHHNGLKCQLKRFSLFKMSGWSLGDLSGGPQITLKAGVTLQRAQPERAFCVREALVASLRRWIHCFAFNSAFKLVTPSTHQCFTPNWAYSEKVFINAKQNKSRCQTAAALVISAEK